MRVEVAGPCWLDQHREFRAIVDGLYRPLATGSDGILSMKAMMRVLEIHGLDTKMGPGGRSGVIGLIGLRLRGGEITTLLEKGYAGDMLRFYNAIISDTASTRAAGIGLRVEAGECSLSGMLKPQA